MISERILKKTWGKNEVFIALFLLAIFLSELAVIFLLGQEFGEVLSKIFASTSAVVISTLGQIWKWIYKMVGPMLFPLLALTAIEIWAIAKLAMCWKTDNGNYGLQKQYKTLGIVEGVAPSFGFLGTCISLIFTMHHMDPNLTQKAMLKVLLENSSSAFGSTVYGISLAIAAFLSLELFKGFLIKPETEEETGSQALEKQDETQSMNFIRREV